jgi:hypothetical protein
MRVWSVAGKKLGVVKAATGMARRCRFRQRASCRPVAPLTVVNEPNGEAVLSGPIRDQAELYGVLLKLYNLTFNLLAVQRVSQ